jgi:hypothetical protein
MKTTTLLKTKIQTMLHTLLPCEVQRQPHTLSTFRQHTKVAYPHAHPLGTKTKQPALRGIALLLLAFLGLGLGEVMGQTTTDNFTTAGTFTWTCPPGVTSITVECWGAGGGGGGAAATATNNHTRGGGGAGGGYVKRTSYSVTPGNIYILRVGAGGSAGANTGGNGGEGEASWFETSSTIVAVGGNGGIGGNASNGTHNGSGGAKKTLGNLGFDPGFSFYGGSGGDASGIYSSSSQSGNSGGGGASAGTAQDGGNASGATAGTAVTGGVAGIVGRTGDNNGYNGNAGGGGAAGGFNWSSSVNPNTGGAGGAGKVVLTYVQPPLITVQPFTQSACPDNDIVSFKVTAAGTNLVYQWQVNTGSGFDDIINGGVYSGATTFKLTITNASASFNNYSYRCVVSGAAEPNAISEPALLLVSDTYCPTNGDYRSRASGAWNSSATWQRFDDGVWKNVTGTAPLTTPGSIMNVKIAIMDGHNVTQGLNYTAGSNNNIIIQDGGTLTFNALTFNFNSLVVKNGGLFVRSHTGTHSSTVTVENGGIYSHNINGGTIPTMTWDVGSTLEITGITSTVPTATGTYRNVIWNASGQSEIITLEGNLNTINGNFVVKNTNASALVLGNTTTNRTMIIGGDLNIEGGTFALKDVTNSAGNMKIDVNGNYLQSGGTLQMSRRTASPTTGTATMELKGNFTLTSGTITNTNATHGVGEIVFSKSGEQLYAKYVGTISNIINFTVKNGSALNTGTSIIDGSSGTFTLESGAGLITANTAGITSTSSGATGSIQVTGTRTYNTGANYTYNGTEAQNTGNGLPATVNNLTFSNTSGTTLNTSATVTGNLTINNSGLLNLGAFTLNRGSSGGTLTLGEGATLQIGGSNGFPTNYVTNTINATSTVIYSGTTQTAAGTGQGIVYGNLELSGSGTKSFASTPDAAGNFIVGGTATVTPPSEFRFSGASAQSIAGLAYNNIEFSGAGAKTFTSNAAVGSTSAITFSGGAGTIDFDGSNNTLVFELKSDVNGSARIGNTTGWSLNGLVTAERYLPARRAWRLLTAPVKGAVNPSIFANWQGVEEEGLLLWGPNPGEGSGLVNGPQANIWSHTGIGWSAVTNTNTTDLLSENGNNAYLVFVTGPYGSEHIASGNAITTSRPKGTLITGNISHDLTANQFKLIANPYASPLDTEAMLADLANSGSKIWLLDPTNGLGAYITYDGNWSIPSPTGNNKYIQSGQAFFIRRNSNSFIVKETHKVAGNSNNWFERNANNITNSESSDKIRVLLYKQVANTWQFADGALAVNSSNGNNEVDDTDAGKIANFNESLSFRNGTTNLSIEYRALPEEGDTQPIRLTATTATPYQLRLYVENYINSALQPFLEDTQTGTLTAIPTDGSTVEIPFTGVVSNATTPDARFRIVYQATLSIDQPAVSNFSVYPNPVDNGQFHIDFKTLPSSASYSISTLLGQQVQKGTLTDTQNTVFLNHLEKGIYLLQVTQEDKVNTKKLYMQ